MFNNQILILLMLIFLPIFLSLFVLIYFFKRNKQGRRSPLTANLLRGAGQSLRTEIEKTSEKINDSLLLVFLSFIPPMGFLLVIAHFGGNKVPVWQLIFTLVFYCLLLVWTNRRLFLLLDQRINLYLGLDAELAVGQELNQLMLDGCRVFHDFPAENFNIDHVVVGLGGVFAIETKGRTKPDRGRGSDDAKVVYDGKLLHFPGWQETKPLDQATRQAEWLQKWLSSAVAEPVLVRPVLALPGWFIDRIKPGNVLIFNGKAPQFLARPQISNAKLSPELIQRITHQLEQRCRDVEPVAYRRSKRRVKGERL